MSRLQFQQISSKGRAADARQNIRALENAGQAIGDLQYRSGTGAQARLPGATSTQQFLGWNGTASIPVWTTTPPVPTATAAPTAIDLGVGIILLNSVTATSASTIDFKFASIATAYIAIRAKLIGIRTATASFLGSRTSSDAVTFSATIDAYSYAFAIWDETATNVGQRTVTGDTELQFTTNRLATSGGAALSGEITLWNLNATAQNALPHVAIDLGYTATAAAGDLWTSVVGHGNRKAVIAQQGLRLVNLGGGNFIDGRIDFFGIR